MVQGSVRQHSCNPSRIVRYSISDHDKKSIYQCVVCFSIYCNRCFCYDFWHEEYERSRYGHGANRGTFGVYAVSSCYGLPVSSPTLPVIPRRKKESRRKAISSNARIIRTNYSSYTHSLLHRSLKISIIFP